MKPSDTYIRIHERHTITLYPCMCGGTYLEHTSAWDVWELPDGSRGYIRKRDLCKHCNDCKGYKVEERITGVSILRNHNGEAHTGVAPKRHHDLIRELAEFGDKLPISGMQGFCTNYRDFVGRKEALKIAQNARQIKEKHGDPDQLYSEDVW